MTNVLWFEDLGSSSEEKLGSEQTYLGKVKAELDTPTVNGFLITPEAQKRFLDETDLRDKIERLLEGIDHEDISDLNRRGEQIRAHIEESNLPKTLRKDLEASYSKLKEQEDRKELKVNIITSENSFNRPEAILASNKEDFIEKFRETVKSFYSNDAIRSREEGEKDHIDLDAIILVKSSYDDIDSSSGIVRTVDQETGFEEVLSVESVFGSRYGPNLDTEPDKFTLLKKNFGILDKEKGEKRTKYCLKGQKLKQVETTKNERERFSLTENQVKEVSRYAKNIEEVIGKPVEIEWVLDRENKKFIITSVREEKIHQGRDPNTIEHYELLQRSEKVIEGVPIGSKIGSGKAKVLNSPNQIDRFEEGDILVTDQTGPRWENIIEKAGGIVTNKGGLSSHTALMARENDIPALVSAGHGTSKIRDCQEITIDCSSKRGFVWKGSLEYSVMRQKIAELPDTETEIKLSIDNPDDAFRYSDIPVDGVGIATQDHMIRSELGKHPLKMIEDGEEEEYIEALKSSVGRIATAFYPDPVMVKLSDLTSKDYRKLEGGEKIEDSESNPELGLRGPSRYDEPEFSDAFRLECEALRRCIDELELDNIGVVVPFCRTLSEGKKAKAKMKEYGLGKKDIDINLKAEVPSNVVLAEEFGELFDGFTIGTRDLTRLTLGVDPRSKKVSDNFDESDPAVKESLRHLIQRAPDSIDVGITGDSVTEGDYREFLIEHDIDSISVKPDEAIETILHVAEIENRPEEKEYEFSIDAMMGTPAGKVYDALEKHGKSSAEKLMDYMPRAIDSRSLNQALGWLGKEKKLKVENRDGEVIYSVSEK